uniref:Kazal-like domain-containing protein n=1 Tax=Homalodisca liturata TaxID=320908 RepID=A0A1B6I576_9HEMI
MIAECVLVLATASLIVTSPITMSSGCQCAIRKVLSESDKACCPRTCSCIYQPVCGFNPCEEDNPQKMFRTFPNLCELEATICDGPGNLYYKLYKGTCVMDLQDETSCLVIYD